MANQEIPKLIIVSPCYNEEAILRYSADTLTSFLKRVIALGKIAPSSRILYVNDGSRDRTWSLIEELHKDNSFVEGLSLAKNVGSELAVMAGMMARTISTRIRKEARTKTLALSSAKSFL